MTNEFERIEFDYAQCRKEVEQLKDLLATNDELQERAQVLPFFEERKQLSAFLGSYQPENVRRDLLKHELPLWGFFADLVVGDSKTHAFTFIEFEDASPQSIFKKRKRKGKETAAPPEWSPRFEHGFSQLVDWFFKLHTQQPTVDYLQKFGSFSIHRLGILVIGRRAHLPDVRETERLKWRQEHVVLNSSQIQCKTFDQLCDDLLARLEQYPIGARAEEKKTAERARLSDPAEVKELPDG